MSEILLIDMQIEWYNWHTEKISVFSGRHRETNRNEAGEHSFLHKTYSQQDC